MAIGHWNKSVTDLIPNYRNTRRTLEHMKAKLPAKGAEADHETIGSMIQDCDYVLEWLHTGRRPGSTRGVERSYRIRIWDPKWLEEYHSSSSRFTIVREPSRDLTDDERFRIEEAMHDLSPREKQCFILYHADGMTYEEIGMELNVGKSTVQTYIERATAKIENAKLTSLFLLE